MEEDRKKFEKILEENKFVKTISKSLEHIYISKFVRYEKEESKVSIDLLINGIGSRQTEASFSFDFLLKNSAKRLVEGIEKNVELFVPRREVLVILKLHSGRLTDLRDIAALSFSLDLDFIKKFLFRGNQELVMGNMEKLRSLIEEQNFQDSFKGVFREKKYNVDWDEIKKLTEMVNDSIREDIEWGLKGD